MSATILIFFFFNDTATTEIYTLSLHDALPILPDALRCPRCATALHLAHNMQRNMPFTYWRCANEDGHFIGFFELDRKSTRLNSSHGYISYAVFCLKKQHLSENLILLTVLIINR